MNSAAELWIVHNEIWLHLIETLPEAGFAAVPLLKNGKPSTGRTLWRNFVHLHDVRLTRLSAAERKAIPPLDGEAAPDRAQLLAAYRASGAAMAERIARAAESDERKNDRPALILLGYMIAHESHHRGQMLLALKQSGVSRPESYNFGIWEHWWKPKL